MHIRRKGFKTAHIPKIVGPMPIYGVSLFSSDHEYNSIEFKINYLDITTYIFWIKWYSWYFIISFFLYTWFNLSDEYLATRCLCFLHIRESAYERHLAAEKIVVQSLSYTNGVKILWNTLSAIDDQTNVKSGFQRPQLKFRLQSF